MISFLMYKQSVAVDVKVWNKTSNTYIDLTSLAYNLPTIVFIKIYVIFDYVRKKNVYTQTKWPSFHQKRFFIFFILITKTLCAHICI